MLNALRSHVLKRRLLGVMLFALLTAQALALAHAVAHGPQWVAASRHAVAQTTDRDTIWGHAAGSTACHLVDQLLTGQATGLDPVPWPLSRLEAARPVCLPPATVARLALQAYEARGPPRA